MQALQKNTHEIKKLCKREIRKKTNNLCEVLKKHNQKKSHDWFREQVENKSSRLIQIASRKPLISFHFPFIFRRHKKKATNLHGSSKQQARKIHSPQ
jgi:hypothetical protein